MSVNEEKVAAMRAALQVAAGPADAGDRIVIFDTTLRDGEQSPGCSMNTEEKLRVAETLEHMGVDVIEAGFPIASEGDFEAVQAIARRGMTSVVCGATDGAGEPGAVAGRRAGASTPSSAPRPCTASTSSGWTWSRSTSGSSTA